MTRYYWNKKDTVEECRDIGISWLKEHGYFCGYRSGTVVWKSSDDEEVGSIGIDVSVMDGDNYARFHYTITELSTGEKTKYDYKVTLTTTPCHFGGVRYWFICPLSKNGVYCGRRVAKLLQSAKRRLLRLSALLQPFLRKPKSGTVWDVRPSSPSDKSRRAV